MKRAILALVFLAACNGGDTPSPKPDGQVRPGDSVNLAAVVAAAAPPSAVITWTLSADSLGAISSSGVYTAPSCAQLVAALGSQDPATVGQIVNTDSVTASWTAGGGGSLVITVTTTEGYKDPALTIEPRSVEVPPGGQVQLVAVWHFTCHDAKAQ